MTTARAGTRRGAATLICVSAILLLAAACSSDPAAEGSADADAPAPEGTETAIAAAQSPEAADAETLDNADAASGDGSSDDAGQQSPEAAPSGGSPAAGAADELGAVEVPPGAAIQIRTLGTLTGDLAALGVTADRAVRIAVEDYGRIHGFDVEIGEALDERCSSDGGNEAAQAVTDEGTVVGVVGTVCSAAAAAAAEVLSDAGMVMISPANTLPALTSDLAGTAGEHHHDGYYRVSLNDLHMGRAAAVFLTEHLGVSSAAAINNSGEYTTALTGAFARAFTAAGATVTGTYEIDVASTDAEDTLIDIAAAAPEALFLAVFRPSGDTVAEQARDGETVLVAFDGLRNADYLSLEFSQGMFFAGPDQRLLSNANQSTGRAAEEVPAIYQRRYGEAPAGLLWAYAYDAAAMLLDAISAAATVNDAGALVIDRAAVRQHLDNLGGYNGLSGAIACDDFGDCGSGAVTVIENVGGAENAEAAMSNVVYTYTP